MVHVTQQLLDQMVAPLRAARQQIGLAVGVIEGSQRGVCVYGRLGQTRQEPVKGQTLFEIGSVTKVFTSVLLANVIQEGLLRLDDRLCDLLPEGTHLPPEITLLQLATHTSGLPRLPPNFRQAMRQNPDNPYAAYTAADLRACLATYQPQPQRHAASPQTVSYSNFGVGLLGYVLAHRLSMSYEEAITSRICIPLGMWETCITLTPAQQARLALPYSPRGKPVLNWDIPTLAGAGALCSTACDLLTFIAANLDQPQSALAYAIHTCHVMRSETPRSPKGIRGLITGWIKRRFGRTEPPLGVALGWFLSRLGTSSYQAHWHNGATGGYRAFVGFVKESHTGVVILANRGLSTYEVFRPALSVDEIGFKILKCLNGVTHSR